MLLQSLLVKLDVCLCCHGSRGGIIAEMRAIQLVLFSLHTAVKLLNQIIRHLLVVLCQQTEQLAGT